MAQNCEVHCGIKIICESFLALFRNQKAIYILVNIPWTISAGLSRNVVHLLQRIAEEKSQMCWYNFPELVHGLDNYETANKINE